MALAQDLALFTNTAYPDRSVQDPTLKTPAWIAKMAKAGVSEFMRSQPDWNMWAHDNTLGENLLYAQGEQNTNQYRRFIGKNGQSATDIEVTNRDGYFEVDGDPSSYVSRHGSGGGGSSDPMGLDSIIRAAPLPILPVKLRGLKSTIMQQGYEATITALGRKADQEARDHEATVRLWMDMGEVLQKIGQAPPPGLPDPMPQTEPELRTYLDNWQVEAAADLERKTKICWIESGGTQLLSEVADDFLAHGYGGLIDIQMPGKRPLTERIPPHRGMFLKPDYPDYRDMTQGGYWKAITLEQVMSEASQGNNNYRQTCNAEGKNWKEEDRKRLRDLAAANLPDRMSADASANEAGMGDYANSGMVKVARWYFLTDDLRSVESYQDDSGNWKTRKVKGDEGAKKGGKVRDTTINCLYECTLVFGTDLAYNCRKVYDQGRDLHNPLKARMPFSLFSTPVVRGHAVSITRNAKGIVDEIERSWRGYMADMRTYMPEGYQVDPRSLQAMADMLKIPGENGPKEAFQHIKQTGDSFLPAYDPDNPLQPVSTITKNPGGIPASATVHLQNLQQQLRLLESVTGANAVVSAATPQGDAQGKGVNQIALQGAANIMAYLRDGLLGVYKNNARNLAGRIWLTEKDVPVTGSVPGMGGQAKPVAARKDLHEYEFFMDVQLGPTPEEVQELRTTAFQATQGPQPQLNIDDYQQICWLMAGNLKTAQRYMAMAVGRKRRQDQAAAADLQKQNGDVQTQTAQATAKAQDENNEREFQRQQQLEKFRRETSWGTVDRQVQGQLTVARGNQQAKVDVAHISEIGSAARTDAEHAHAAEGQAAEHQHNHESTILSAALAPPPPVAPVE
ncbi:MAG: hypothetical protein ACRYFX_18845 [Janthinobacterium lividum]